SRSAGQSNASNHFASTPFSAAYTRVSSGRCRRTYWSCGTIHASLRQCTVTTWNTGGMVRDATQPGTYDATVSSTDGPIFVVGTMRSGSTLLRLVLDAHPDVAIGMETGFMRAADGIITVPGFLFGERWYERQGLTLADLEGRIAAFYDGIFRDHAHAMGRARW